jgi:6-phosphogluconolactonase
MGLDRVMAYQFDAAKGKLAPAATAVVPLKAGTGPRHMVFRPDGRFAYVLGSKSSTITTFAYDAKTGGLKEVEAVSTLPPWFEGANSAAELAVHPSDSYLYASNRGHNSVVLFSIDRDKGTLTFVEEQNSGGKSPRHFGLDAPPKHVAVANEDSGHLVVCRIDNASGRLTPSAVIAQVASPTCVKFLGPKEPAK